MKLERFFEKFDQFADAPDAVAKMRELVLGFAFTGRLTNKSPKSDGVPDGWENRTIDSIALSMTPGFACSRSHQVKGGHVHLRTHNVSTLGTLNFDLLVRIDPQMVDPQKASINRGDILFNNTNSQELVGKTCLVDRDYDYGFSNHLTRIRLKDGIDPRFVAFYLTWLRNQGYFAKLCTRWINQAAVNTNTLKEQTIPLPALVEQKQIVAKVDELMALCDLLETQQKKRETRHAALTRAAITRFDEAPTPANLNFLFDPSYSIAPAELRKTILGLAVRGKLTPQNPNDERAETCYRALGRREQNRKNIPEIDAALDREIDQAPFALPESWIWLKVAEVFDVAGGIQKTPERAPKGNAFPYVSVGNVYRGRLDLTDVKKFELADGELDRRRLEPSDLLIIEGNGSFNEIGRCAKWNGEIPDCVHQNHVIRCRPNDKRIASFILLFLNSPVGVEIMQRLAITSSGLYSLSVGKIRQIMIPLPPLAEQDRIVAKVDHLMDLVDELEAHLAASETTAKELLNAVVHELLHPTADVVEFPRSDSDRASERAAIGCYAIEHLLRNPSFGHTMNMKVVYMAQAHIGLPLNLTFERQAAGPWHPWIEEFDTMGQSEGWFTVTQKSIGNGHTKYEYAPKAALKQKVAEAATVLGEHKAEFDRLLGFFADMKTVDAEIVATLFAAWNDFLIDGKTPTDDEIIHEVRENWNVSKQRFTPERLATWLKWMRKNRLIPQGRGPRTQQQLTLALN